MAFEIMKAGGEITVQDTDLGFADGDPDITYTLKLITRSVYSETVARHTKSTPNRQTRAMERVVDWEAVGEDLIDHCLTGWTGILENGQPAACTRANKLEGLPLERQEALVKAAGAGQHTDPAVRRESFRSPA